MKTKEELNALKEEAEAVNKKLHELTEEELAQVSGGGLERVLLFTKGASEVPGRERDIGDEDAETR